MLNRGAGHLVITEEGIRAINNTLGNLVLDTGAKAALLMEKSGQMISAQGETNAFDTMSLSALITGSFNSTKAIATLLGESEFKRMFQQGSSQSIFMFALDSHDIVAIVFPNTITVGKIKYKVEQILDSLNNQIETLYNSAPSSPLRAGQALAPKIDDLF